MTTLRRILLVVLLVAVSVGVHLFITRNSAEVALDFLAIRFEAVPVWLVMLGAFGGGLGLSMLVALLRGTRLRLETRRYRKATRNLESEVHELRNLPLAPNGRGPQGGGGEIAELTAVERES